MLKKLEDIIKNNDVIIYFDMDGTCVRYSAGEKSAIKSNKPNFYLEKEPVKTVLKIMKKLNRKKNVEIGIISNCHYAEQKRDKLTWLHRNAPFIKDENIHIIELSKLTYTKEEKPYLKAKMIEKLKEIDNRRPILIEDDLDIILATFNYLGNDVAFHVSNILK